ncbi:hypothetical protein [Virgibacillus salexigens]|uniref:Uncharacterized protein n=1 Tax=Virgibacillus massiliensis TaxID=1462526 RepID=A0A024QHN5_9BACI|nr:hypothetical protein [Virgibacillus massiliensis]CDQ41772.1 hypothetical protein BN990_04149 [Virgibacillus massiliensis]
MHKLFETEINKMESLDIKTFAENAMVAAPASFKEDEDLINYTRKVFVVAEELLENNKIDGNLKDIILTGVLLSDIAYNEDEKYRSIHPFLVRPLLNDVKNDLVPNVYEAILKIVERHEGVNTPIAQLHPQAGSLEHLVAIANVIVRSKNIQINV